MPFHVSHYDVPIHVREAIAPFDFNSRDELLLLARAVIEQADDRRAFFADVPSFIWSYAGKDCTLDAYAPTLDEAADNLAKAIIALYFQARCFDAAVGIGRLGLDAQLGAQISSGEHVTHEVMDVLRSNKILPRLCTNVADGIITTRVGDPAVYRPMLRVIGVHPSKGIRVFDALEMREARAVAQEYANVANQPAVVVDGEDKGLCYHPNGGRPPTCMELRNLPGPAARLAGEVL